MSKCFEHGIAIGSWRANSPSWPDIATAMRTQRPDTREQSILKANNRSAAKERESIYRHQAPNALGITSVSKLAPS
jgi:hypothetical protein